MTLYLERFAVREIAIREGKEILKEVDALPIFDDADIAGEQRAFDKNAPPFGYVALYCGQELFFRDKEVADHYATCCEVVPVCAVPSTEGKTP